MFFVASSLDTYLLPLPIADVYNRFWKVERRFPTKSVHSFSSAASREMIDGNYRSLGKGGELSCSPASD
ncbi:MAG: hypothetical protein AAGE99_04045 [Chlamydiota bacterium]